MLSVISGVAVIAVTGGAFWALLPRGDKLHRWADTEWEPYVSVAICSGVALGFTLLLSGAINLFGTL